MNILDGRNFSGIVLERGKTEGDADTIMFKDGRFRSSACDRYEYGDGPYTATAAGDSVSFEARTESPSTAASSGAAWCAARGSTARSPWCATVRRSGKSGFSPENRTD